MPFGSGGGGGAFTGGTIPGPLTINDNAGNGSIALNSEASITITDIGNMARLDLINPGQSRVRLADNQIVLGDLSAGVDVFSAFTNYCLFGYAAAPADGALAASSFALWLDATPGATKLMVKAKDSGGTVRSAAIALA